MYGQLGFRRTSDFWHVTSTKRFQRKRVLSINSVEVQANTIIKYTTLRNIRDELNPSGAELYSSCSALKSFYYSPERLVLIGIVHSVACYNFFILFYLISFPALQMLASLLEVICSYCSPSQLFVCLTFFLLRVICRVATLVWLLNLHATSSEASDIIALLNGSDSRMTQFPSEQPDSPNCQSVGLIKRQLDLGLQCSTYSALRYPLLLFTFQGGPCFP